MVPVYKLDDLEVFFGGFSLVLLRCGKRSLLQPSLLGPGRSTAKVVVFVTDEIVVLAVFPVVFCEAEVEVGTLRGRCTADNL